MLKISDIRNLSIRNKMTLLILAITTVVLIIAFAVISLWDIRRLKNDIQSQLFLNATLIGDYCIVPLIFSDQEQASQALSRLKFFSSVLEGSLLDKDGDLFASFPATQGIVEKESISSNPGIVYQDGIFNVTVEVLYQNERLGTLQIKSDSRLLNERLNSLILVFSTIFLFVLAISYVMVSRLQRLITDPILKLAGMAESISLSRDFSTDIGTYGNDEVGVLYRQFKTLMQMLLTHEKEREESTREIGFLAHVLRNINESISITDINDKIIFVNQSFLKTYGYEEGELTGKDISIIRSDDTPPEIAEAILPATLSGGWQGELMNTKKDGTQFPVMLFTTIIYDEDKQPAALVGICTDITERKEIQEELIRHKDHLEEMVECRTKELNEAMEVTRDLYENAPCGYHSVDQNGVFTNINKTELEILGYTLDEVVGRIAFKDLLTEKSSENYQEYFDYLKTNGSISNLEFEMIRKDGSTFFASLNATAIYDSDGEFLMSRSTVFDITERIKAEKELSKAIERAEMANRAKSEFLANMSHEIRTPMNAVLGYTELLSSLIIEPTQKSYIESVKASGRNLLTLINDILDLSKIEAGKLELEYDFIDSRSFFGDFEKIFSLKAREKGIEFIVESESGFPAGIYIDEPRLRQILFNLIGNAMKFTSKGDVRLKVLAQNLQVHTYKEGVNEEYLDLVLEVSDTGIGISKELREEIFDPFIQSRDSKNIGGTGLGLAITRRLTTLMNGSISLESVLGEGSKFTVTIPDIAFRRDFESKGAARIINPSDIKFKPSRLLLVDDIEHNRGFIRDALLNTAVEVFEADDGFLAFKLAKEVIPSIIITDIRMPNMDGFELLRRLREEKNLINIPVLAYSASVLKDQKERIYNSDFAGLLTKPLAISELFQTLMNYLPYEEVTENGPKAESEESSEIKDPKALLEKMETAKQKHWKGLQERQPMNDVKTFGRMMIDLGETHSSRALEVYGTNLLMATDNFDIEAILKLLNRYPTLIDEIKKTYAK